MKNISGVITALVTPFQNGKIDFESLKVLLLKQEAAGVSGYVINGTTGESPNLSSEEIKTLFDFVKANVAAAKVLIVGTGSNSTTHAIHDSKFAEEIGADAVLSVVPYYNKPPQRGLVAHFTAIAKSVQIPVILYNVPSRTITSLSVDSIVELSKISNIVGIKEASGNIEMAKEIRSRTPNSFIMLSGDDGTYVDFLKAGGNGVISVTSHLYPERMVRWTTLVASGNYEQALKESNSYKSLCDLCFCEANPIPVKMALHKLGVLKSPELRLPLVELNSEATEKIITEMNKMGVR